jgi:hypothetical protein
MQRSASAFLDLRRIREERSLIKKRFLKTIQGVCLGVTLSLFGVFGVFAEPLGLSTIDGQIITSRMGGFQAQVPASYQVDRMGGGWEISRQLVAQMKTSDQMQIDFAASMVNETDKTYIVNMGFVMPADDGTGIPWKP